MAVGSITGQLRPSGSLGDSTPAGLSSVTINQEKRSRLDSVDTVTLSTPQRQKQESFSSALRNLSDLQSFTDAASSATARVGELVQNTIDVTTKLQNEVDPTKRAKIAADGAGFLAEIDKITSSAQAGNGKSVVDQGQISFSLNLGDVNKSTADSISVNVASVNISRSDLGLTGVTAATLQSSTDANQSTLLDAQQSVSNTAASLQSVSSQIGKVADQFSTGRANEVRVTNADDGENLAKAISQNISSADIVRQASNLDPLKVADLLRAPPDEIPKPPAEDKVPPADSSQTF